MLTDEENAAVHALCNELEAGKPSLGVGWYKLRKLAEATGDEWERLARQYLAERATSNTSAKPNSANS